MVAARRRLTLALVTLLATGCAAEPAKGAAAGRDAPAATDTLRATDATDAATATDGAVATSFTAFWPRFRAAVLGGDTAAVAELTRFPFRTRGQSDDDPVEEHDRAAFPALLARLLAQDPGLGGDARTMRALVERTPDVDTSREPPDEVAVGDFVFERADGVWRFARAFTNP